MTESDLMEYVRADFEAIGYTTYAEVCWKGGGSKRCDMYARIEDETNPLYGHTIAFEAKMSFNLKVVEQGEFWSNKANNIYIIVPTTHKNISSRRFMRRICELLGIGVIEVNVNKGTYHMTVKSLNCDKPKMPTLYQEQRLSISSNSNNQYVTPFKITVKNIVEYMENIDEIYLTQLMSNIKHHYKSNTSAVNNIRMLVNQNVIPGFYITKKNNKIVLKKYGF